MSEWLHNWTGDLRWRPARIERPQTHDELVAAVRSTDMPIRVLGAGHSFAPLATTDRLTIQLDGMSGLELVDTERWEVTVRAGTRLAELGPRLAEHGLAIENQGDIDAQSLAGALSTATHGTGARLGCIASQVRAITLVTATGDDLVLTRGRDNARFQAAAVSLGCLGVISRVRLKVRSAYLLRDVRRTLPLDECLAQLDATTAAHRHFEFFWFPYTDLALTKTLDIVEGGPSGPFKSRGRLASVLVDNLGLWLSCQACRAAPGWTPVLNRLCTRAMGESEYLGPAHRIFPTPRL